MSWLVLLLVLAVQMFTVLILLHFSHQAAMTLVFGLWSCLTSILCCNLCLPFHLPAPTQCEHLWYHLACTTSQIFYLIWWELLQAATYYAVLISVWIVSLYTFNLSAPFLLALLLWICILCMQINCVVYLHTGVGASIVLCIHPLTIWLGVSIVVCFRIPANLIQFLYIYHHSHISATPFDFTNFFIPWLCWTGPHLFYYSQLFLSRYHFIL